VAFYTLKYAEGVLRLLDQRALPAREEYVSCRTAAEVAQAIREMVVRGAPAIGCAAAYGLALTAGTGEDFEEARSKLLASRPTAVNLRWALDRMARKRSELRGQDAVQMARALAQEAQEIEREDLASCRAIGDHGALLVPDGKGILTHCNAGALATSGYGTALGVIRSAIRAGKKCAVFAGETRPWLQGARLTAWELLQEGIPVTVLPDVAAASLLASGRIGCVVVGADRIARNGDTANKIGTYPLALAAQAAQVPFYVAAPISTVDLQAASGAAIPIEERGGAEVTHLGGARVAAEGVQVFNPAFDVTPSRYITAIITERGVARALYETTLPALFPR
jgi:methylthioribose-1-phosphate isomerase